MPIKEMSYSTAAKITNIYADLLESPRKRNSHGKYYYSDLKGYDFIDISNAVKLMTAYRVFITLDFSERKVEELKSYAEADTSFIMQFFLSFSPDKVISELERLKPNDELAIKESLNLTKDLQSEMEAIFYHEEMPQSFLDFCLNIDKSTSDYWHKVYNRLEIKWETKDKYDRIFFAIEHGHSPNPKIKRRRSKPPLRILAYLKNFFKILNS